MYFKQLVIGWRDALASTKKKKSTNHKLNILCAYKERYISIFDPSIVFNVS